MGNNSGGSNNTGMYIAQDTPNNMGIDVANQANTKGNLLLMPYGGEVGIGTTSPLATLDVRGLVAANGHISNGTTFTIASGCGTPTTLTGGATTGSFKAGQTACAPVITLPTAPHGWWCQAWDITTTADTLKMTADTTASCGRGGETFKSWMAA